MKQKAHIGAISLWLEMMKNPATRKVAVWVPVLAIVYVLLPVDFVPDLIPLLGWTDDLMMAFTVFAGLSFWMRNRFTKMVQKSPQQVMVALPSNAGREIQI